ncbi:MAG: hypothetical protein J6S51_04405 [Kiritimatiellae bacterium]|nr:hypothetical protein [Kiritimatiellia bacterium]
MRVKSLIFSFIVLLGLSLFSAPPVAKWDVIPLQRIKDVFNAGVVAFHEKNIEIEFFVNGTSAFKTNEKILNPRTGVKEYVFPFNPASYSNGKVILTALVKTSDGASMKLPELPLYANAAGNLGSPTNIWVDCENGIDYADGTESAPVQSLSVAIRKCGDGGTIYCKKGVYKVRRMGGGFNRKYWTTICPAPGLKKGDVKIRGGRPATDLVKFKDVDIFIDVSGTHDMVIGGEGTLRQASAWFDNCRIYNRKGAQAADTYPFGNKLKAYVTGGVTAMLKNGPCNATLIRNHKVLQIVSEAFSGNDMLVINSTVKGIDPGSDTEAKPALFAGCAITPEWLENIIFYGVKADDIRGNGILGVRMRNSAFVDVEINAYEGGFTRFSDKMENVFFKNVVQKNLEWDWHQGDVKKPGAYVPADVRAYGCKAKSMYGYPVTDGSTGLLIDETGITDDL